MSWNVLAATIAAAAIGTAQVDFPTSGSPAAQKLFSEGVLLLHSFEYDDARELFRQAREVDPDFVMAAWGEAMTHNHPIWLRQDRAAALAALEGLGPTAEARAARAPTERERDYLASVELLYGAGEKQERDLAYAAALRRMTERYPDDFEAAAFYSLALLGSCNEGRDVATFMRAAAVSEEVFAKNPRHPGAAHYLIHSYDEAIHAPLGLRAARVYAGLAPAAAHAQHMPSHIFLALGMWDETVDANQRSWDAADTRVARLGLTKSDRGYHALAWLAYAHLQQGRYDKAAELLAIARGDALETGLKRMRDTFAMMRATHVIESRRWDGSPLGVETADLGASTAVADLFARGYSMLETGKPDAARAIADELKRARKTRVAAAEAGCHAAGSGSRDNRPALMSAEVMELELGALIDQAAGRSAAALETLRRAAALEDSIPSEFGPPGVVKPAHELLGEILLAKGDGAAAIAEFDLTLARMPGRSLALLGRLRAAAAAGRDDVVAECYARLRANWADAESGMPTLEVLLARR